MKKFPEFQSNLEAVRDTGNRVLDVANKAAKELIASLRGNTKALALALGLTFTGGTLTSCNQQTTPSNHPPEADITELVESVQAGEVRIAINDLLRAYGVEDPDGDQLQVEVIEGNASIENGYLIADVTQDSVIKLKVSDGKRGEIILTLRLDVNHAPEVSKDVVIRHVTLPQGATSFSLDWDSIVSEIGASDPDGDNVNISVDRLEGATTFSNDGTGIVSIEGVQPGVSKVVVYLKIQDSNGGETSARVEINISWEAVDHPTTVSDVTLNVVDRAVSDDTNGVYAGGQFEISGTLSDPDGLPTDANLVLEGAGVSYPIVINSDGTFSAAIDTGGLEVGEYLLKVSGQDASGNSFVVDTGEVVRVYPWGEIVDSTIKVHDEIGNNTYREARYDIVEDGWWLDNGKDSVWFRVEGITQQMVDNGDVKILINSVAGDPVNAFFPASGLIKDPDGSTWIGLDNDSIFPSTGHDDSWLTEVEIGGIVVTKNGRSYLYPTSWVMKLGDGY